MLLCCFTTTTSPHQCHCHCRHHHFGASIIVSTSIAGHLGIRCCFTDATGSPPPVSAIAVIIFITVFSLPPFPLIIVVFHHHHQLSSSLLLALALSSSSSASAGRHCQSLLETENYTNMPTAVLLAAAAGNIVILSLSSGAKLRCHVAVHFKKL